MALDYVIRYAGKRIHGARPGDSIAGGTCDMEAGSIGTLTFDLPPTHPMARPGAFAVEDPTREVTLSDGDVEIFRGWVKRTSLSIDLTLTVECESMLAYLKRTVVRPYACSYVSDLPDGATVLNQDPFEWMVAQHNLHCGGSMTFEVGVNPHVGRVRAATDWKTTWDEMNDAFCTGLDRYLNARSVGGARFLDLLDGGAGEGTQVVVLGENVVEMEVAGESGEVVTAIIPRGTTDDSEAETTGERIDRRGFGIDGVRQGERPLDESLLVIDGDRAYNQRLVDVYGMREEKRDYEATNVTELLRRVAEDLNPSNVPDDATVSSVTVQAVDLHALNPDIQPISLLEWDRVFIRAYGLADEDAEHGATTGGRLVIDQWLPCTQIHVDLSEPANSTYRFGDLPQTLTRQSALRLGMLRRGNGSLVRRTDAHPWDDDRIWNRTDDVWDHVDETAEDIRGELSDATDQWAQHLDEQFDAATQQWYASLDEVSKQDAQGREEILKHLDEVEGKWSDDFKGLEDSLGDELSSLGDTVDSNHRTLLDGIRDVAANAQRTFFAICRNDGGSRTVSAGDLTMPGGEQFKLEKGAVVDVQFLYSCNGAVSLDIASTGSRQVRTNGFAVGVWQPNQVVRMLYDGAYWQACSTDIYGTTLTVGNPAQANFYVDGKSAQLRIGDVPYVKSSVTGQTVGLTTETHVDIGSSEVEIVNPNGATISMASEGEYSGAVGKIRCDSGLFLWGGEQSELALPVGRDAKGVFSSTELLIRGQGGINFETKLPRLSGALVVMRSIAVTGNGSDTLSIAPSALGISNPIGYSWAATNGDLRANYFLPVGCGVNSSEVIVKFDRSVSGSARLNLLGVPVGTVNTSGDVPWEGPEVFGDGGVDNGPSASSVDHPDEGEAT